MTEKNTKPTKGYDELLKEYEDSVEKCKKAKSAHGKFKRSLMRSPPTDPQSLRKELEKQEELQKAEKFAEREKKQVFEELCRYSKE